MKLLRIKIAETVNSVFNFDAPQYERTYVLERSTTNPVLFSIPVGSASESLGQTYSFQTENGRNDLFILPIVENASSTVNDVVAKEFTITLIGPESNSARSNPNVIKEIKRILNGSTATASNKSFDKKKGIFKCHVPSGMVLECRITFIIQLVGGSGIVFTEQRSVKVILGNRDSIYFATLDFGSEASQVLEFCGDATSIGLSQVMDILTEMGSTLGKPVDVVHDAEANQRYIQYDKDDHLFRSHFFAPKRVNATDPFKPEQSPASNPHLKLLNTYSEIQTLKEDYFTLPNVKIETLTNRKQTIIVQSTAGFNTLPVSEYRNRYFYRSSINAFIYLILRKVCAQAISQRGDDGNNDGSSKALAYLRLTILMPNVYDQPQLSTKLKDINEDVAKMLDLPEFEGIIRGVEVNSISESDASILGLKAIDTEAALHLPKGNYLIMDAGKGTLDFSVLRFDPDAKDSNYICKYRSGIVGSGNAISYAVFLDLMTALLKDQGITGKNRIELYIDAIIRHLVAKGDEALVAEMMRYVDRIKCIYGESPAEGSASFATRKNDTSEASSEELAPVQIKNSEDGQMTSIVLLKDKTLSLNDIVEFLKTCFTNVNNYLQSQLKITDLAMTYTDAMIQNLADSAVLEFKYREPLDFIVLTGRGFMMSQFKKAVLKNIRRKMNGKWAKAEELAWNERTTDYNPKNVCLFVNDMIAKGDYDGRVVGQPFIRKYGEDTVDLQPEEEEAKGGVRLNLGRARARMISIIYKWFSNAGSSAPMKEKEFDNGIPVVIGNRYDQICISGRNYSLPIKCNKGQRATIFFDGDEFIFVTNNQAKQFGRGIAQPVDYLFESMFPYGNIPANVPFPRPGTAFSSGLIRTLGTQTDDSKKKSKDGKGKKESQPATTPEPTPEQEQGPDTADSGDSKFDEIMKNL